MQRRFSEHAIALALQFHEDHSVTLITRNSAVEPRRAEEKALDLAVNAAIGA